MPLTTKEHKLQSFGKSINNEMENMGLTLPEINGWWNLKYKKKVTPKQYALLLFDTTLNWGMLLASNNKGELKRLQFPLLHLSYPVSMSVIKAVSFIRGNVKTVPQHVLKDFLRSGVDVPTDTSGVWSF